MTAILDDFGFFLLFCFGRTGGVGRRGEWENEKEIKKKQIGKGKKLEVCFPEKEMSCSFGGGMVSFVFCCYFIVIIIIFFFFVFFCSCSRQPLGLVVVVTTFLPLGGWKIF